MRSTSRKGAAAALVVFGLIAAFFACPPAGSAAAASAKYGGKVVMILIPAVTPDEMPSSDTPFLSALAARWSVGIMSCWTADKKPSTTQGGPTGAEYLTIGWGTRTRGAAGADFCFDSGENFSSGADAGRLFTSYNRLTAPASGAVAMSWEQVQLANDDRSELSGALGDALAQNGRTCAVVGNEDTFSGPSRPAALICSDSRGKMPLGRLDAGLSKRSTAAAGMIQTDEAALVASARDMISRADFIVVDTGDTGRIDEAVAASGDAVSSIDKRQALARADRISKALAGELDLSSSMLLVVSPVPPLEERLRGNFLAPVIAAGKPFGKGRLFSETSRRTGLLSNIDLLPTVLHFFSIKVPAKATGAFLETTDNGSLAAVRDHYRQHAWTIKARWPVMIIYLVLFFLMWAAFAVVLARKTNFSSLPDNASPLIAPARFLACGLIAAALSVMVISLTHYGSYVFPIAFCVIFSVVLTGLAWLLQSWRPRLDMITTLCVVFVIVLIVDQFTGARFHLLPLLGANAFDGLRFYGMSNVVAGLVVACSIWGIAGIVKGSREKRGGRPSSIRARVLLVAVIVLVICDVSLGGLGANVGPVIYGTIAFGVFIALISKRGLTKFRALVIVAATVVALFLLETLDAIFFRTHASNSIRGGWSGVTEIIGHKLATHFKELSFVILPAIGMILAVVAVLLVMRKKSGVWPSLWSLEPEKMSALYACMVGGVVGLVFEDTGVTVLGAMVVVSSCAVVFYALGRLRGSGLRPDPSCFPGRKP